MAEPLILGNPPDSRASHLPVDVQLHLGVPKPRDTVLSFLTTLPGRELPNPAAAEPLWPMFFFSLSSFSRYPRLQTGFNAQNTQQMRGSALLPTPNPHRLPPTQDSPTLLDVKHVHGPHEFGLPVEPALPQAPEAEEFVLRGHEAGEGPFVGDVGKLGPRSGLGVEHLEGVDGVLGLPPAWVRGWEEKG